MTRRHLVRAVTLGATVVATFLGASCDHGDDMPLAKRSVSCPIKGDTAAQGFRRSFGLDTSKEAIERATAASKGFDRYGVPLTAAELKEIDRRQAISAATNPLRQLVHDHPEEYGQLWIDQLNGGITVVQIAPKGDKAKVEALMARRRIRPKLVRFERVNRSMAELLAVTDDFMRDEVPKLRARGIEVQSGGPDLPNEVRVQLVSPNPRIEHELAKAYPGIRFGSRCG